VTRSPLYKDFLYKGSLSKCRGFPLVNPYPWATLPTASVLILALLMIRIYYIIDMIILIKGKKEDGGR
jgi:hypothetical protein